MTNTKTTAAQTYPAAVEAAITCKPWASYPRGRNRVEVHSDGSVLVWDEVARHFTRAHSLSERTCRRIFRDLYPSVA